ncbi:hypothetical protein CQA67_33160, partial [Klebsiella pneumoniae]
LRGGHRAEQRALASFIEKGHYARHLAAMPPPVPKQSAQLREQLRGGHRAEQRALASFIEKGHYARHLAAMPPPVP